MEIWKSVKSLAITENSSSFFIFVHPLLWICFHWFEREWEREPSMWKNNINWLPPDQGLDPQPRIQVLARNWNYKLLEYGMMLWDDTPNNWATQLGPEESFLQVNQCVKVDIYVNMRNLLNKMRVTLVKSFDEQPKLLPKCKVFNHGRWINLGFWLINYFFPDTERLHWCPGKYHLNMRERQFIDRREVCATYGTLLF